MNCPTFRRLSAAATPGNEIDAFNFPAALAIQRANLEEQAELKTP